ncbi:unnamed protein product [Fraxinus pennsylvanica]|uniref:Uncharacterized protein n=1 Tax=Fraxinus pennsylvanica TaxID=56036 RepID=A0AAD1ZWF4_9LAMI|nr:unnamed protein product [Fraxinus pennsylvanica]
MDNRGRPKAFGFNEEHGYGNWKNLPAQGGNLKNSRVRPKAFGLLIRKIAEKDQKLLAYIEEHALLHLAPNSPDAKVFQDFGNSGKKSNGTATPVGNPSASSNGTSADQKSDGGKRKKWLGMKMASAVLLLFIY